MRWCLSTLEIGTPIPVTHCRVTKQSCITRLSLSSAIVGRYERRSSSSSRTSDSEAQGRLISEFGIALGEIVETISVCDLNVCPQVTLWHACIDSRRRAERNTLVRTTLLEPQCGQRMNALTISPLDGRKSLMAGWTATSHLIHLSVWRGLWIAKGCVGLGRTQARRIHRWRD